MYRSYWKEQGRLTSDLTWKDHERDEKDLQTSGV